MTTTAASLPIDRFWIDRWRGECVRHPVTGLAARRQKVNAFNPPPHPYFPFHSFVTYICYTYEGIVMKSLFIIFISARADIIGTSSEEVRLPTILPTVSDCFARNAEKHQGNCATETFRLYKRNLLIVRAKLFSLGSHEESAENGWISCRFQAYWVTEETKIERRKLCTFQYGYE